MVGMRTILLGTHQYQWALWPFATLFAKYVSSDKLLYIGDKVDDDYLPDNIEFMQVPAYAEGEWNWYQWFSDGFISILEQFRDELLLVFLPDHWINREIDHAGLDKLVQYMADDKRVFRAALRIDCPNTEHIENLTDDFISIPPFDIHAGFHGGITFCPSIWRPELALNLFESGWDLWKCEKLGTEKARLLYPAQFAIAAYPGVLSYTHGLVHTSRKVNFIGLNDEDRRMVMESLPEGMIC